jgi:hypothetical protein
MTEMVTCYVCTAPAVDGSMFCSIECVHEFYDREYERFNPPSPPDEEDDDLLQAAIEEDWIESKAAPYRYYTKLENTP